MIYISFHFNYYICQMKIKISKKIDNFPENVMITIHSYFFNIRKTENEKILSKYVFLENLLAIFIYIEYLRMTCYMKY